MMPSPTAAPIVLRNPASASVGATVCVLKAVHDAAAAVASKAVSVRPAPCVPALESRHRPTVNPPVAVVLNTPISRTRPFVAAVPYSDPIGSVAEPAPAALAPAAYRPIIVSYAPILGCKVSRGATAEAVEPNTTIAAFRAAVFAVVQFNVTC